MTTTDYNAATYADKTIYSNNLQLIQQFRQKETRHARQAGL